MQVVWNFFFLISYVQIKFNNFNNKIVKHNYILILILFINIGVLEELSIHYGFIYNIMYSFNLLQRKIII